jgi:tetratricopeptide (TPR) repeat protein
VTWLQRATTRQPPFEHAFCELGRLLGSLRRFDEAEVVLQRGLQVAPNLAELSVLLGSVFLEREDHDRAKLAFARALVNAPGHPVALGGMGAVLMQEGDFARAAERFAQALARDPADVRARLSLGACQLELIRWDEGLASLRAAIQMAPQAYAMALKIMVTSAHGRFWLKPSAAIGQLRPARGA